MCAEGPAQASAQETWPHRQGPADGAAVHEVECEACYFKGKKAGVDVERRELLGTVGNVNWGITMENSPEDPQEISNGTTI